MKTKDYLIIAVAPLVVLLIPLVGVLTTQDWKWSAADFLVAWIILAGVTALFRFLVTRQTANLSYRLASGLAVATGFLVTWINLAVQIIGDENPAFVLYFVAMLIGLAGVGLSRFHPRGMAKAAFVTAAALFVIPIVAVIAWPVDFSPGMPQVFALNSAFVLMFIVSGLLFRHAASRPLAGAPSLSTS